jgi:hypothetical protein
MFASGAFNGAPCPGTTTAPRRPTSERGAQGTRTAAQFGILLAGRIKAMLSLSLLLRGSKSKSTREHECSLDFG